MNKPKRASFWLLWSMGISLFTAMILSSFASSHPDGLERVAEDLQFDHHANADLTLPGSQWLADYTLQGVPPLLATPLAGGIGTLAVFGLTWGMGIGLKSLAEFAKISASLSPENGEELEQSTDISGH